MPISILKVLAIALVIECVGSTTSIAQEDSDYVVTQRGNLPILISAPHGGTLEIPDVKPREGKGVAPGAAGYRVVRDGGTEELALEVVRRLAERMKGQPSFVISRVHRRYVDFNRPPEVAAEDLRARVVYDEYHSALKDAVTTIRHTHKAGLLVDIHGQGSSASTAYRGTSNGLTVSGIRSSVGELAHIGPDSLLGRLKAQGWKVHPDPFDGKEQPGFTGGYIVRTYGSHHPDGIDAIQLELGADFRKKTSRDRVARELSNAIAEYLERNSVDTPAATSDQKPPLKPESP